MVNVQQCISSIICFGNGSILNVLFIDYSNALVDSKTFHCILDVDFGPFVLLFSIPIGKNKTLSSLKILNTYFMKRLLLVKEIYLDAFRNIGHFIVEKYFKMFAWFSFIMFFIVLYAFIYRIATGFAFD